MGPLAVKVHAVAGFFGMGAATLPLSAGPPRVIGHQVRGAGAEAFAAADFASGARPQALSKVAAVVPTATIRTMAVGTTAAIFLGNPILTHRTPIQCDEIIVVQRPRIELAGPLLGGFVGERDEIGRGAV